MFLKEKANNDKDRLLSPPFPWCVGHQLCEFRVLCEAEAAAGAGLTEEALSVTDVAQGCFTR